ncbi:hypothetical protein EHI42_30680 [Rhizobium hidalgonense]|uniref:hypothetical protein n=1 Tax=Rhizobium hidalgonense TaxID=1538159 RepID=UPI000FEC570E|nr:hypothetical protein [Rhizobium hidalgonense]RWX07131.1 hypothetical protein EHI42_30680 [Rhizobium hidalgonense]
MKDKDNHPEQGLAEGGRETIEKNLKRQSQPGARPSGGDHATPDEFCPDFHRGLKQLNHRLEDQTVSLLEN